MYNFHILFMKGGNAGNFFLEYLIEKMDAISEKKWKTRSMYFI